MNIELGDGVDKEGLERWEEYRSSELALRPLLAISAAESAIKIDLYEPTITRSDENTGKVKELLLLSLNLIDVLLNEKTNNPVEVLTIKISATAYALGADASAVAYIDPYFEIPPDAKFTLDGDEYLYTDLFELTFSQGIRQIRTVHVDFTYTGLESGTQSQPYNTLAEAITAVAAGGEIIIKGGITKETFTGLNKIKKKVTIKSSLGTVVIGK